MAVKVWDKSIKRVTLHVPLPPLQRKDLIFFVPLYAVAIAFFLRANLWHTHPETSTETQTPADTAASSSSSAANATASTAGLHVLLSAEVLSTAFLVLVATAHALTALAAYWSVRFRAKLQYAQVGTISQASFVCVYPAPHCGSARICELFSGEDGVEDAGGDGDVLRLPGIWFECNGQKYVEKGGEFEKLDYPTAQTFGAYLRSKGYVTKGALQAAKMKWGRNEFDIPLPGLDELFIEHALSPFFLFQVFCVALWCLDDYWYYSVFTLVMLVIFEITVCKQRQRSLEHLRLMRKPPYPIYVYRGGAWTRLLTDELLPGDICSVVKTSSASVAALTSDLLVPCDMLLLHGTCVVNEAMLTGESVPKMKDPIAAMVSRSPAAAKDKLSLGEDDQGSVYEMHLIRGGTSVVQHRLEVGLGNGNTRMSIPKPPDHGCVAIVLRTGFATSQGSLVRTILYSTERVSVDSAETYIFILILLVFAIFASMYVLYYGLQDERQSRWKLFLHCTMIITSVVPPELPMELSLAVTTSLARLQNLAIFCTEPYRIPTAGKLDVCCFDKTGTLTSDNLKVVGVALLKEPKELTKLEKAAEVELRTTHVLAACHQLIRLGNKVEGDTMEKAAVRAVRWSLGKEDNVLPREASGTGSVKEQALKIISRHPFSSALKRMSVVVTQTNGDCAILTKGAPEVLQDMYTCVPQGYEVAYQSLMRQGKRVLALGHRFLPQGTTLPAARRMPREEIESSLDFVGLLVLDSPLKEDTAKVVSELKQAGHRIVMATGDNALTACDVSRQVSIIGSGATLMLSKVGEGQVAWVELEEEKRQIFEIADVHGLAETHELVVSGDALLCLEEDSDVKAFHRVLRQLVPHVKVFARVAPQQKEIIIAAMKAAGLSCLMCGDGTNDVGALKQADIGVSIINSPEMERQAKRSRAKIDERLSRARGKIKLSSVERMRLELKAMEQEQMQQGGIVQLGDASIASPFTSRSTSIVSTVHIILQGRCTLVTTIQMFKILGLNCLISAYSLTSLYLLGVKQGDTQSTIAGLLIAVLFMLLSYAKPLETLSAKRPTSRIFTAPTALSMAGQFIIHMLALVGTVQITRPYIEAGAEEMAPDADFKPNVVNTAIFLVGLCMQVNVFSTNYRGHPFMESLWENKTMHRILAFTWLLCMVLATEAVPGLGELFELVPMPSQQYKATFVGILLADTLGVACWEFFIRNYVE